VTAAIVFWLVLAGLSMGAINNLAGAAGVLGLIAFEEACGMSPELANGSLRLAAIAIGLCGWLGFASRGVHIPPRAWRLALWTVPGAVLGVALALRLPVWLYRGYLLVVMLAVLWQQLRNRMPRQETTPASGAFVALGLTLIGVHMGFVQIGVGLLAILVLTHGVSRDLVEVNTTKMALVIVSALVSTLEFTRNAAVAWPESSVLALAAGAGSFWASRWSVAKGHAGVRVVVLVITVLVILRLLWQVAA
jgi:hypothetical protein